MLHAGICAGGRPQGRSLPRPVIQWIMRHSTITLAMDRYTHAFRGDEAAAIAKLPGLQVISQHNAAKE